MKEACSDRPNSNLRSDLTSCANLSKLLNLSEMYFPNEALSLSPSPLNEAHNSWLAEVF